MSPGSCPGGSPPRGGKAARRARSATATLRSGKPRTWARPSARTMSAGGRLELLRGQRPQPVTHTLGGHHHGAVDRHRAATGEGPAAGRRDRRVGRHEPHALERNAEAVGDHLGDRGLVPLPLRGKARGAAHAAVGVHRERGGLHPGHIGQAAAAKSLGAHAGVLRVARQADAHESAGRARGRLRATQPHVVRQIERLRERLREIAAVVRRSRSARPTDTPRVGSGCAGAPRPDRAPGARPPGR